MTSQVKKAATYVRAAGRAGPTDEGTKLLPRRLVEPVAHRRDIAICC